MNPFRILVLALAACAGDAISAALPEFVLSDGTSGGRLEWLCNSTGSRAPTPPLISLDNRSERYVSLELCWSEKPDPRSNESLISSDVWRVPESIFVAPSYTISAERISAEEIVFALSEKSGAVLLRSPPYRLQKVVFCPAAGIKRMFEEPRSVRHRKPPAHR